MCFTSQALTPEQKEAKRSNKLINQVIHNDQKQEQTNTLMKILLLGTGDSGKSTFAKQMAFIHNNETITKEYCATFIPILRENALQAMQLLLKFFAQEIIQIPNFPMDTATSIGQSEDLTPETATKIKNIWGNEIFQKTVLALAENAHIQGGVDGAKYYFEHCERFAASDFNPTKQDILKARRRTSGVHETRFAVKKMIFSVVDVGGQRLERRKWINCFDRVSGVIFLTAINEFDMVLEEDSKTNRMVESLKLWGAITKTELMKGIPFILFLNKSDLFNEKIKKMPLTQIFSDYQEYLDQMTPDELKESDFDKGWKYLLKQFKRYFGCSGGKFYPHLTCALDTDQCSKVFDSIYDNLLDQAQQQFT